MVKGFRQIALLTMISRMFGLIRDICYSHFFGANALLDAWTIAFKIPNLSRRLFGEGAAASSLIPVYSEALSENPKQADKLINTVVTVLFVLLGSVILAGEGAIWIYYKFFASFSETKLVLSLASIMLPYMLLICMVAIFAGILNVHKHFACPAAAPIILNIFIITSIILTGHIIGLPARQQLFYTAITVVFAGIMQIFLQLYPLKLMGIKIRLNWQIHSQAFKKIIIMMGPMVLGLTATELNTLTDDLIAWWLSASVEKGHFFILLGQKLYYPLERGSVSYLYYSQRLYQLPLGVLGISLATAIFPVMSTNAARKDFNALSRTISKGLKSSVFVAIPATAGLFLVARPLVSAMFEHGQFTSADTPQVSWTLACYSLGLCGYFTQQITTRAFYSMQQSKLPAKTAAIAVFVNIVLNMVLVWFMATAGLALSTAICSYLQVIILITALRKRFGNSLLNGFTFTLIKTIVATAVMTITCIIAIKLMNNLPDNRLSNITRLAVIVPLAVGVYTLMAKFMRIEALSLLTANRKTAD